MPKARVILTFACSRNCPYCCNGYASILDNAVYIKSLSEIPHRDEIMFTGGEPTEHIELLWDAVREAHRLGFKTKYLYTAKWHEDLDLLIEWIDGVQYTLHANYNQDDDSDAQGFWNMQALINRMRDEGKWKDKTFRCFINPAIRDYLDITPCSWTRLEIKPWREEGDCPLPHGETLYVLEH